MKTIYQLQMILAKIILYQHYKHIIGSFKQCNPLIKKAKLIIIKFFKSNTIFILIFFRILQINILLNRPL
jgi:hypothetical protein